MRTCIKNTRKIKGKGIKRWMEGCGKEGKVEEKELKRCYVRVPIPHREQRSVPYTGTSQRKKCLAATQDSDRLGTLHPLA